MECGVNRVLIRSKTVSGKVTLRAEADGLAPQTLVLETFAPDVSAESVPPVVYRASDPMVPTFRQTRAAAEIAFASADTNVADLEKSYDDNERSEWKGGNSVTYTLRDFAVIDDICLKLSGWRSTNYALEVEADGKVLWRGITPTSLGYVHLEMDEPIRAKAYTIRTIDKTKVNRREEDFKDAEANRFSNITEVAGGKANELDATVQTEDEVQPLRIVEVEFLYRLQ